MAVNRQVAGAIEKFLNDQINCGAFSDEKLESLQVALQCIQAVYDLEESPVAAPADLVSLLSNSGKNSVSEATEVSEADQKEAERLKAAGNDHLTAGRCPLAIECYSKAIKLDARNPVYFSNRAAAYTKAGQYEEAIADCQEAIKIDPAYAKAYGRLGAAYAGQKKNKQAIEAYKQALELDPSNAATKSSLEALLRGGSSPASPTTAGANMKMPGNMDLGSLLNNPELMSMAQQMMSNGAMDKMMKDPSMMKMMQSMMGGVAPPPADEED